MSDRINSYDIVHQSIFKVGHVSSVVWMLERKIVAIDYLFPALVSLC